ncbi:transposase [Faecalibacterium duncaniae]|uniref:transposase n=1 Tax=Faecalibacterium duncaniae (strain DSM 17677 / JCM 31915 / A2-165) TaxID=411483 RepID=UPI003ED8E44D
MRLNKKKKSTNTSPYPDEAIERLARAFYPAILACWNSEEGQREFAAWQAEQAHIANNEKQEVPVGELPALLIVCGFLRGASGSRVPIKQYLQKFPQWGRFGVTSVTPFLLLPVHPEGYTPAHHT